MDIYGDLNFETISHTTHSEKDMKNIVNQKNDIKKLINMVNLAFKDKQLIIKGD